MVAPVPTIAEGRARQLDYSERDRMVIAQARIEEIQRRFQADEIIIVSVCEYAARLKSYELLAHAFELTPR